jgi:hypothetical protein
MSLLGMQCHLELHLGDKILSPRIQSLGDILGEVHKEFNDSPKEVPWGSLEYSPRKSSDFNFFGDVFEGNSVILISLE